MRTYYIEIKTYMEKLIKNIAIHDKKEIPFDELTLGIIDLMILKTIGVETDKKLFEIIKDFDMDRNSLVASVNKLQQQGLISKRKSQRDKRVQVLNLTTKGKKLLEEINHKERGYLNTLLKDFSFNEERAILKFLVKLDMLNKEQNK
ncbi:MAG: winged helix DNA-binding protein [Clostridiaceae bacterium]|nr:winged helix DNA-binding protein [Clostridiaceae bacterium]